MLASPVEVLAVGSELHGIGLHICQLDLLGIADYIVFVDRICNVCAGNYWGIWDWDWGLGNW